MGHAQQALNEGRPNHIEVAERKGHIAQLSVHHAVDHDRFDSLGEGLAVGRVLQSGQGLYGIGHHHDGRLLGVG